MMTERLPSNRMPGSRKCEPGCTCHKHNRSDYHNRCIGEGVAYANQQKAARVQALREQADQAHRREG